jgi:hypothetical protein
LSNTPSTRAADRFPHMSPFYAFHTARGQARRMLACTGSISLHVFCFATINFFHASILDIYSVHLFLGESDCKWFVRNFNTKIKSSLNKSLVHSKIVPWIDKIAITLTWQVPVLSTQHIISKQRIIILIVWIGTGYCVLILQIPQKQQEWNKLAC